MDLIDILNKQKIQNNMKIIDLENYEYNDEYILELWKYFLFQKTDFICERSLETNEEYEIEKHSNFEPILEIYELVKPYFETIYSTKKENFSLQIIPNKRGQESVVIMKLGNQFYVIFAGCQQKQDALRDIYIKRGVTGNIIAVCFSE